MEEDIKDVYEKSCGTAYETCKEAVVIDNSIQIQDARLYE